MVEVRRGRDGGGVGRSVHGSVPECRGAVGGVGRRGARTSLEMRVCRQSGEAPDEWCTTGEHAGVWVIYASWCSRGSLDE